MERRFGHEGMFKKYPEIQSLMESPEQVFDSSTKEAEREHQKVMERLVATPDIVRTNAGAELCIEHAEEIAGSPPQIRIAWPSQDASIGALLTLHPIPVGKGQEGTVLGYTGSYGIAERNKGRWEYIEKRTVKEQGLDIAKRTANIPEKISLDELFGIPEGKEAVIKPTATRWAVGKDELSVLLGEETYTLYMGLGFLLLPYGHRYMAIGMHEGGHLYPPGDAPTPNLDEESAAWAIAADFYRQIHNPEMASAGGQFELLRQQAWFEQKGPTMKQIMQYGLVSHYLADTKRGNNDITSIPEAWKGKDNRTAKQIMEKFQQEIERAHQEYKRMTV